MTAIVEELLQRTNLPDLLREANEAYADEQRRRADFIEWLDEKTKAEFINGEVVVHSPERLEHGEGEDNLKMLIKMYVRHHDLGLVAGNKLFRANRNDYIPDLCYWAKREAKKFGPKKTLFPAPSLIVEILSDSTASNDRGVKFGDYAVEGVREYWIVDAERQNIEQYKLVRGRYKLVATHSGADVIESVALPGLRFAAEAAFDPAANLAAVSAILAG